MIGRWVSEASLVIDGERNNNTLENQVLLLMVV
jgi:hypothetical protein